METVSLESILLLFVGAFISSSFTETALEIKVNGAFQIGMGKYVIPVGRTIELICKTRQFPGAQLWIFRNDEMIMEQTFTTTGMKAVSIDIVGEENTEGLYTCRFYRMVKRRESQAIYYTTENTINITVLTQTLLPRCFSSLGETGLSEEEMTVVCGIFSVNPPAEEILWRGLETSLQKYGSYKFYLADIQLNNQPSDISCGYFEQASDRNEWTSLCTVPPLVVLQHTGVTMEPSEFNEINETLRFTCTSDPPASLIRWNIFGHSDNIIDDYYTTKIKGEMRVNITQGFGKSTLTFPSSAIKLDGVHIVACSTKRGNFQMAVSEYTSTPSQGIRTTLSSSRQGQGPAITPSSTPTPSLRFSSQSSGHHSAVGYVVVIVLLVIIVLILGLFSLWLYKNHRLNRNKNNNHITIEQSADGLSLSVAQRNATYQPLNSHVIAPPAYADLDVGYATMSTPQLDDQHYMEPSIVMKGAKM